MLSRRDVLRGAASAAVIGFSASARAWVGVGGKAANLRRVPSLDGELLTDPASLSAAATDAGSSLELTPLAVLRPGSVQDIQKMVRFCRQQGISVSARGQGHTTNGQGLNEGGLVIDMGSLSTVHEIGPDYAVVDAGIKWNTLVTETVAQGLTPPVLTGYLGLSVGGTLSVGGISAANRRGAQVDNVRSLEIVNGKGQLLRCSPHENSDLFEAALGGLGQCGIITRATLDLIPAPAFMRVYTIDYADSAAFFADLRKLLRRGEVEDAYNFGIPDGNGGLLYQLTLGKQWSDTPPNDAHLLRGLSVPPSTAQVQDVPFLNYALRVDVAIDFFKSIGLWDGVMHPWFDVFLPDRTVEPYVSDVVANLTPEDLGPTGFLLLFAQRRVKNGKSMLQLPECDEWVFLFDILTAAPTPGYDAEFDARMRDRNRSLFDRARDLGGVRYPIGTLDFDRNDWRRHYGFAEWARLNSLKRRHDPDMILTPGPGIF
jgi:FAD/FMN-containing dehydrogenase